MAPGKREKAAERLKELKNLWGASWRQMGDVLGVPYSSLSVYASADNSILMPEYVADLILGLDQIVAAIENRGSGSLIVTLDNGEWHVLQVPPLRVCLFCHTPFFPQHPQQLYCTGYRGKCGLAMRRRRRKERKHA